MKKKKRKAQAMKTKINKQNNIKLKSFSVKGIINEIKMQPMEKYSPTKYLI